MPSMVEGCRHKLVANNRKLFALGGFISTCEVFDATCDKFALLQTPPDGMNTFDVEAVSIDNKLVVFSFEDKLIFSLEV